MKHIDSIHDHRKRVLIVNTAVGFGGAETRVLVELAALQQSTSECHLAALAGSPLHRRAQANAQTVHAMRHKRYSPLLALKLYKLLQGYSYDVVIAHNVHSILWAQLAARLAGTPTRISTIHSDYLAENPGLKGRIYHWICTTFFRHGTQFVTVTDSLYQRYQSSTLANQITLIPNGISIPASQTERPPDWPASASDFVIGCIARLVPLKDHDCLFRALAKTNNKDNIQLVCVGDGPMYSKLKARAQELGIADRVFFLGQRDDLEQIYPLLDCVCLTSTTEAMPYTLLEAAANRVPIVATSVGGIPALFEHSKSALLSATGDASAIAKHIDQLHNNPELRASMTRLALQAIMQYYSVDKLTAQLLALFNNLQSAANPRA